MSRAKAATPPPVDDHAPEPLVPAFAPVPVRPRRDGWTADRQRRFIETLAETGCVATAAGEVALTPRSAYRLAARPDGQTFAQAWDLALSIASRRLAAIAFNYATQGMVETVTDKNGDVVAERRRPSERILIYLLGHLDPHRFGRFALMHTMRPGDDHPKRRGELARLSRSFVDVPDCPAEPAPRFDAALDSPDALPRA
jgi:hypothetical protein